MCAEREFLRYYFYRTVFDALRTRGFENSQCY